MSGVNSRGIMKVAGGLLVISVGYLASQIFSGGTVFQARMSEPISKAVQRDLDAQPGETKLLADELEKQKQIDERVLEHERRQAALEKERLQNAAALEAQRRRLVKDQQDFREEMRQRDSENARRAATDCNDPNYNVYLDPGNCNKPHEFDQR